MKVKIENLQNAIREIQQEASNVQDCLSPTGFPSCCTVNKYKHSKKPTATFCKFLKKINIRKPENLSLWKGTTVKTFAVAHDNL